jgi:hypothetical protein
MLMILGLGLGLGLGWVVHRVSVEREAVAAIEAAGGQVLFDHSYVWFTPPNRPSWWPIRLRRSLGEDYFRTVT